MPEEAPVPEPGPRGVWFEGFEPGRAFLSPGRTLTEADLVLFAGLSGDYTALHTDEEHARRTPFRRRIAHGMLVQSIATGLACRMGIFEGTILAMPAMDIRWTHPSFPGDTLRLALRVAERDPEPARRSGRVRFEARVQNQDEKVVAESTWEILVRRAPASQGDPTSP